MDWFLYDRDLHHETVKVWEWEFMDTIKVKGLIKRYEEISRMIFFLDKIHSNRNLFSRFHSSLLVEKGK